MTTTETRGTPARVASTLLHGATLVVLAPLGALVGAVSTVGAGWLTRYWEAASYVPTLVLAALAAYLVLLYAGARLVAWGCGSPVGAVVFGAGYVLALSALVGYTRGGDLLLTAHIVNYAYMFGAMLALALAFVRSGLGEADRRNRFGPS